MKTKFTAKEYSEVIGMLEAARAQVEDIASDMILTEQLSGQMMFEVVQYLGSNIRTIKEVFNELARKNKIEY